MNESPNRALIGGLLLAFLASAVNVQFLLSLGTSVSHLTGDVSRITSDAIVRPTGWSSEAKILGMALLGFLTGATACGYFVHHPTLSLNQPYGRSISGIGLTLILVSFISPNYPASGVFLAAAACGFQNALATRYKGLVLRTTHVTGLLTDIGQMTGMRFAGHVIESWKIIIQVLLVVAFVLGALGGAALHLYSGKSPLLILGIAYLITGCVWSLLKHRFPKS